MVREASSESWREKYAQSCPDLHPDFIFAFPGFNVRPTEIGAAIGRSQLQRLDHNNSLRVRNFRAFLERLDPEHYVTDFRVEGSCNYAFVLILRRPDTALRDRVMAVLRRHGVEFRRGTAGGGNQLRQPYLRRYLDHVDLRQYPVVDHVHFFGFYIGNYPTLEQAKIVTLCRVLNELAAGAGR
jgi:CDP-6-deoxy-D-xylo-4-hexulose-3-dehydrase